jgi:hypothetical protein
MLRPRGVAESTSSVFQVGVVMAAGVLVPLFDLLAVLLSVMLCPS